MVIYDKNNIRLYQGDAREELKQIDTESVDCCIVSPPYWRLRTYLPQGHPLKDKEIGSERTREEHIATILSLTLELKRILKPIGSFWLNYGESYGIGNDCEKSLLGIPWRIAIKMMDEQGWILRSDIKWIKQILLWNQKYTIGSVMPTSVKDRFNQAGEYLFHFVKNPKYYFNLDPVRLRIQTLENRPLGIERERDYPGAKRNRFDYAPFTDKNKFNYRVRDAKKKVEQCPQFKATEEEVKKYREDIRAKEAHKKGMHTFYSHSRRTKQDIVHFRKGRYDDPLHLKPYNEKGKNIPNAWLIQTEPSKELHFARFPAALCEIPILTSCPEGGVVLDFFMGSGQAGVMALKLNRKFIGCDINESFIKIAIKKLEQEIGLFDNLK